MFGGRAVIFSGSRLHQPHLTLRVALEASSSSQWKKTTPAPTRLKRQQIRTISSWNSCQPQSRCTANIPPVTGTPRAPFLFAAVGRVPLEKDIFPQQRKALGSQPR